MKRILLSSCLLMGLASALLAAGKDPEVKMVDGKLTIQAEEVTLKQFLQLFDSATGMTSRVAPQLANEKISVRLEGVDVNTAIRKSFQGRPWNYVVAVGKGINIIDRAQLGPTTATGSTSSPITNDIRPIDSAQPPNNNAFSAAGPVPVPAPAAATAPAGGNAPATLNLPPAQGGPAPAAAPASPFQPVGTSLGQPLPGTQPAK